MLVIGVDRSAAKPHDDGVGSTKYDYFEQTEKSGFEFDSRSEYLKRHDHFHVERVS